MEVLISAFIMAVGLLGVASLLPVGHHEANSGTIADRASLIAKQAFRDFRIRGYVPGIAANHGDPNPLLHAPAQTDADNTYARYRSADDWRQRFTYLVVAAREPYNTAQLKSVEQTAMGKLERNYVLNYVPPEKDNAQRLDNPADHSMMRVIVYVFYFEDTKKGLFDPSNPGECVARNRPVAVFEKVMRVEGESMWKTD
jgi:hypothetical protein